jgi:hypothetical protein
MANPIKAVKAIGRAVGGITGKGSRNVSPTYKAFPTVKIKFKNVPGVLEERLINYTGPSMIRHMKETGEVSKAQAKANKRGLKAAKKPTNKVGSKADKELRASTKSVSASKEQTKAQYDYYYGKGTGDDVTQINKSVTPKNEARSVRTLKPKPRKPIKRRGK